MGNPKHRELEIKVSAMAVEPRLFRDFCYAKGPERYLHIIGPDDYYVQGENVLRHRKSGGPGELTVKRRTSMKSTRDRVEIDLKLDHGMTIEDVAAFLAATGWERQFTVVKDCHIFWFEGSRKTPGVEAVIYDVKLVDAKGNDSWDRYVEIEIHKEDSNHPMALSTLRTWEKQLRAELPSLGEVVSESLYEIYSGNKYSLAK